MQTEWCCWQTWKTGWHPEEPHQAPKVSAEEISFNLTRLRARCFTWADATSSTNTGWGRNRWRAALPRRTWGCWRVKGGTWPSNEYFAAQGMVATLGCIERSSLEIPIGVLHPALGPSTLRAWINWIKSGGGPQGLLEGCSTSPVRESETWNCSPWRGEGSRVTLLWPSSSKRQPTRRLERNFHTGM